jgi:hypothetical protein
MAKSKKSKDPFRIAVPGEAGEHPPFSKDHGERFIPPKGKKEFDHLETKPVSPHSGKNINGVHIRNPHGKKPTSTRMKYK